MQLLVYLVNLLAHLNERVLDIGKRVAFVALMLMVLAILIQVVCRYLFNNALAWTDEAARFLMLWMTGLVAPFCYRQGGFVAIESIHNFLPEKISTSLSLVLYCIAGVVLFHAVQIGWNHVFGFAGTFNSSSLRLPFDLLGGTSVLVKLRYMYASLFVCVVLLFIVNIELILRLLVRFCGSENQLVQLDTRIFEQDSD